MSKVYSIVTENIIKELDKGKIPWKQHWVGQTPRNYQSKRAYTGLNRLMFMIYGGEFEYQEYLTLNQVKKLGGRVKNEEFQNGLMVIFYKIYVKGKKDTQPIDDDDEVSYVLRYYKVWNITQCEGIEFKLPEKKAKVNLDYEQIIINYKNRPTIKHGAYDPRYDFKEDAVYMPTPDAFNSIEDYYCTLFHELVHSTGHPNRLGRELTGVNQKSESYSKEELIAELGSAFLSAELGIENKLRRNAGYIQSWKNKLKNDEMLIVRASSKAQQAIDYMKGNVANVEVQT